MLRAEKLKSVLFHICGTCTILNQMKTFYLLASLSAQSVFDVVASSPDHKTLASLASSNEEITNVLKTAKPITLFAPTDAAFEELSATNNELYTAVANNASLLATVLKYHVIPSMSFVPDANTPFRIITKSAEGTPLVVDTLSLKVNLYFRLSFSNVTASIPADNGIVHVVNKVLLPPKSVAETATDAKLTSLVMLLTKYNLVAPVESLSEKTIFAPTDAAFAEFEKEG